MDAWIIIGVGVNSGGALPAAYLYRAIVAVGVGGIWDGENMKCK